MLFLMPHSGCHCLRFWRILVPQLSILGTPLALSGVQNDTPNRQNGAKNLKIMKSRSAFFRNLKQTFCQGRFWNVPGHHLNRFWMNLGWIFMDIGIIFDGFKLLLCSSICRIPKPPGTKRNNGKRQEHADHYRNMQTSNARKNPNHQFFNRELASCRMPAAATNVVLQIRGRRCSRR